MHKDIKVNVSGPMQPTSTYKTVVLKGQAPFAAQVTEPNMKYVIKHNFDLEGENVTIPENCVLEFDGGSISNGTLVIQDDTIVRNAKCNDVQFYLTGTNIQILSCYIENNTIGMPIVSWRPKSNIIIDGCTLINRTARGEGLSASIGDCIFFSIKNDIENIAIRNNTMKARQMCIEMYQYSQDTPGVTNNLIVDNNVLESLIIGDDDITDLTQGHWPISFSKSINNSSIVNNTIIGGYFGIEVVSSHGVVIANNVIKQQYSVGIYLTGFSRNTIIQQNHIVSDIASMKYGLSCNSNVVTPIIDANSFENCIVLLYKGEYRQITNNVFTNAQLFIESNNVKVSDNTFMITEDINKSPVLLSDTLNTILINNVFVSNQSKAVISFTNENSGYTIKGNQIFASNAYNDATLVDKSDNYENGAQPTNIYSNIANIPASNQGKEVIFKNNNLTYPIHKVDSVWKKADSSVYDTPIRGTTANRPDAEHIAYLIGYKYFDTDLNKPIYAKNVYLSSNTVVWVEADGAIAGVKRSGSKTQRPSGGDIYVGFMYTQITSYGTKVIWAKEISGNTVTWINVDGTNADTKSYGTFADKPTVADNNIPIGFMYFCTNRQTTEGASNGIPIFLKGQDTTDPNNPVDVWVDALGRVVS